MTVDETLDLIASWQMARIRESEMIRKIIATNDIEFIKSFIENDDIRIEANIQPRRLVHLILATKDMEYVKTLIEDSQKMKKLGIDVMALIEETDVDYKKELALNAEKREKLGINIPNVRIIASTDDPKFIKGFIEDEQKRKNEKLGSLEIRYLLESTNDIEYIRNIVEDEEKIKELLLNEEDVMTLKKEFYLEEKPKKEIGLNDIGKKVFVGENAITGPEYAEGVKIIQNEIEKDRENKGR